MRARRLGPGAGLVFGTLVLLAGPAPAAAPPPGGDEAALEKVVALNRLTGTDPANGALKALLEDRKGSKEVLREAKALLREKKTPLDYNAALILALLAEERKDTAASASFYRVCIDQAKKLLSGQKLARAYVGLIALYYDHRNYEDCVKACKELLELKADDGKPKLYLLASREEEEGEPVFEELKKYNPVARLKPRVHQLMVQAVARQGKFDEAIKLANNLVKAQPDEWENLQLKGWVYREAGKYDEAARIYEEVIDRVKNDKVLEPKERKDYLRRYRYMLSNLYGEMNQIDKATTQLKALLDKDPDDPTFNNDLAYLWADHDLNLAEAEKLIRKALREERKLWDKANPDAKPGDYKENGAYLDTLAWVLYKQKKYGEAKEVMLKVVKDRESQALEIYDHLGDIYLALKDKAQAVKAWKKGLTFASPSKRDQERKAAVEKKIKANE